MASATPPLGNTDGHPSAENGLNHAAWDIELLRVLVDRKGTRVDAQWAIHPQLKKDLPPGEWREVTELMAKVTDIVGHRFSKVLSDVEPASPGHA